MTHDQYREHVAGFLAEMRAVTEAKNPDYSAGHQDAMANYHELAAAAGVTPVQAWMCLMMKHVTAIMRYAKTGSVSSEAIHGRFVDLANYAMLGDALVKDLAGSAPPADPGDEKTRPVGPGGYGGEGTGLTRYSGSDFWPLAVR